MGYAVQRVWQDHREPFYRFIYLDFFFKSQKDFDAPRLLFFFRDMLSYIYLR